jgi:ABC-2 type transport system permease protein
MTDTAIIPATERKLKNRVSFGFAVKNTFTLAYRAWLKMVHSPEIFFEISIMPILFTLLFTFLFGGAVSGGTQEYLPTIIPGILVMCCAMGCSSAGSLIREDMDKSVTSRLTSMPIARIAPVAGMLLTDIIRYLIIGVIVFVLGFILGYRPASGIGGIIACIALMTLASWCLSWLFAFVSISAKTASSASSLGTFIMFPLAFLSNCFVPADTLPGWLEWFVMNINPLSRVVTAMREILANGAIGSNFWFALLGSAVLLAIFAPLTLWAYKRKA